MGTGTVNSACIRVGRPLRGRRCCLAIGGLSLLALSVFAADPSVLAKVLGTAEVSYPARIAAARALSRTLANEDITALYGFLDRKAADDPSQPGELDAIKNDVVNQLKAQNRFPLELPSRLMAMYGDRSHDEVWRDYCIQHLGDIVPEIRDEAGREKAIRVLWSATDERQGSIPGTGLIALFNLCGGKGVDRAQVAAKALAMVKDPGYGEPAKITALQIGAKLGDQALLPLARKLAAGGAIPIRMSAMACLGMLGDKSDLELLKASESSTDVRLSTAAQAAIKRLSVKRTQE